jgi:A/G-specific adenine glycosylase
MLQQTQVAAVIPYFERFLRAYPTVEDLARADENEVLDLWSGLGYYSRARNLHRAAQIVSEQYSGEFPTEFGEALKLPGIGRYSAGAILSIAYGQARPALDGNVRRVMARYLCIKKPLDHGVTRSLWTLMSEIVQEPSVSKSVASFNQAIMELGALVCTARSPRCSDCPLEETCLARKAGLQGQLPRTQKKAKRVTLGFTSALIRREGRFLMLKDEAGPILRGFWEFPKVRGRITEARFPAAFRSEHDLDLSFSEPLQTVRHRITFRELTFHPVLAELNSGQDPEGFSWVRIGQKGFPVSAYIRKIVSRLPPGQCEAEG